jgi:chorismate mutase/prephenate dehydratase
MSDNTPPSTSTDTPPTEDGWRPDLALLRGRLDELDDNIHGLLMDRARVVESVAHSGKAVAFRPGREAAILRRLLARHGGKLPAQTLVRMWREMLAGTTAMQTAVTVAVFDPAGDGTMQALAREHFGFLTPVVPYPSAEAALRAVRAEAASLAVLPFPTGSTPWWLALTASETRLHIVVRLPFWATRPPHVPTADALVVAAATPDASGIDRSFIAAADWAGLSDAGLVVRAAHGAVCEVDGLLSDGDTRLPSGAIVLGGYAVPVPGEQA